jgi:NADPH-dependent curcumin reductase
MNKKVLLAQRPSGMVRPADFRLVEESLPALQNGQLLVRIDYVSIDPAMRGWMNEGTTYIQGVDIGETMRAFAAGIVVESLHPGFAVGDAVQGLLGVQQFAISDGTGLTKVDTTAAPLSWHLGLLGMPGLTAYFGLLHKGQPQPGDTVLVSGAAGMIGSLVGQMAQLKGCQAIGIAGGKDKCDYLVNELGFAGAIDYTTEEVATAIRQLAPNGVDIYFDNVGGDILESALLNLARGARVVVCGAISQYNDAQFNGLKNYMKIVSARATLSGIIVFDYFDQAATAIADINTWVREGKIKYREHVVEGLAHFAEALQLLFTGGNHGKLVLKVEGLKG